MLKVPFQQMTGIFWSFVKCVSSYPPSYPQNENFCCLNGAVRMGDQSSGALEKEPGAKPRGAVLPLPVLAPSPPAPQPQELRGL